jgi:FkbM family methyltransferase
MPIITDLVSVKDERWCWPNYDNESYPIQISDTSLMNKIRPFLKNKYVAVQAGGNCGITVESFVLEFETVYTFEPDPLNFYCLNVNLPYLNLIKFQACLGDTHKMIKLNNGLNTTMKDVGAVHIDEKTSFGLVPMLKIDDLKLSYCDLIQLDIEGFEYYALMGGIETIKKFKPVLCIEMNKYWMARYNTSPEIVEEVLKTLGYKLKSEHIADKIYVCES